jgi:hypothetical protein
MKYENPHVLATAKVEIGKSYLLAELPAGIRFRLGGGIFRTVIPPKYNLVSRNCQGGQAEVWNERKQGSHRIAYRKKVRVIGLA